MTYLLNERQIGKRLGGIGKRKWLPDLRPIRPIALKEKLRMAYNLGYEQGHESQLRMRIRDAQEARERACPRCGHAEAKE